MVYFILVFCSLLHINLQVNMDAPYGSEWPTEEKVKRKEMVAPEARYIFVYEDPDVDRDQRSSLAEKEKSASYKAAAIVGFVHFRFILEEEVPVLYVYEIQLETRLQGKGLGKFLMELIEQIAHKVMWPFSLTFFMAWIVREV